MGGPTSVAWRGLTVGGPDSPYRLDTLEGWEDRPPARYTNSPRSRAHGSHRSQVLSDERIVTVTGWSNDRKQRDELLAGLQAVSGYGDDDDVEPLTITAAGRTLTAGAQLLRAVPSLNRGRWGSGWFGWLLQWRCPDPLRYGPPRTVGPIGLPTDGDGLTYSLTYPLAYGQAGSTGQMQLRNAGTAPAPVLFTVRADLPDGAELSSAATGERLTYARPIPGLQIVEFDTAEGTVMVEGTSSRRAALTSADWLHVPAHGQLTVQFSSLGGAFSATAQVTATTQDTYW